MKSLRGKPRSLILLGFNSLLSQQAAGNLTKERLKYEDFLTKRAVSHYKFSSELNHASDSGEISGDQKNWGYEDGPCKGPVPAPVVAAD